MASSSETMIPNPPKEVSAVFIPHYRTTIEAPARIVFEILTSPSTWPDWNLFVPGAELISRRGASGIIEPYTYDASSGDLQARHRATPQVREGDTVTFKVAVPISGKGPTAKRMPSSTQLFVSEVYVPKPGVDAGDATYRVIWGAPSSLSAPSAKRVQDVEPLGEQRCEYRSYEEMGGPLAYVVKWTMGGAVQRGVDEWGEGLKRAAEERWVGEKVRRST